jgi:hypothetical protein
VAHARNRPAHSAVAGLNGVRQTSALIKLLQEGPL